ncbi:hypothetical protein HZY97_17830 [Sphingomonas sp. R-74633]|uniref:hypothetical protein n=1 Tax=Sphingomonas sp. R-74633 TaxID=2751188 RepID=UPI0015D1871C|nr:hypothetical protein [Sphingomonas sp. R-74633]NYT42638.1 hypothetical protein [Sphingomonas sp. R-74633]
MTEADAWFVRRQRGANYQIVPRKPQGWLVLAVYILSTLAFTPVLRPPTTVHLIIWLILIFAATAVFSLVVWRTSVPAQD